MAVGLIKKQIIHTNKDKASPLRIFGGAGNKEKLGEAEDAFDTEMTAYRAQEFKNPYAKNVYEGMENTMEDLTINQKQSQFQAQQNQQSQANMLNAIQSGGGFNAGNIQALSNQSQLAAQQASASIGQQESGNTRLKAQEASRLQQMERQGRLQVQSGEAKVQQMQMDKQSTLLGMSMQQVGNAQDQIAANQAMWGNIIGGVASITGSLASGGGTGLLQKGG
tara:strand:+ start:7338 stop:8003 length:666 start_codon:yes stop_codon:yes gene_type:complete